MILKSLSFLLRLLAAHPTVRIRIPCISFMLPVSITMDSWAPILFSGGVHVPFIYSDAQILADSASGGAPSGWLQLLAVMAHPLRTLLLPGTRHPGLFNLSHPAEKARAVYQVRSLLLG